MNASDLLSVSFGANAQRLPVAPACGDVQARALGRENALTYTAAIHDNGRRKRGKKTLCASRHLSAQTSRGCLCPQSWGKYRRGHMDARQRAAWSRTLWSAASRAWRTVSRASDCRDALGCFLSREGGKREQRMRACECERQGRVRVEVRVTASERERGDKAIISEPRVMQNKKSQ